VPDGENLHDVASRVQRFFEDHDELMDGSGIHLIVGHRNVNKMILKHLLELSGRAGGTRGSISISAPRKSYDTSGWRRRALA
jgi:broad specificity phosphatase PhoE